LRFRELAVDQFGHAHLPLYPYMLKAGQSLGVRAGHPIIAENGDELKIQVTHISRREQSWIISVNNPSNKRLN
jgi:hypothetical protein